MTGSAAPPSPAAAEPAFPNCRRGEALAAMAGGIVVPVLAFLLTPAAAFVSDDVRALEGVVHGAAFLGIGTLLSGGVLAAAFLLRGRRLAQEALRSYTGGILLARWTYADADLQVARRIWRARRRPWLLPTAWAGMTLGPLLPVVAPGIPWTATQGLVIGGSVGLGLLIIPLARNYFLDHAGPGIIREVRIWSDGVFARGVAHTFGRQPGVALGMFGREPLLVLRVTDRTGRPVHVPIPREEIATAQAVAAWFGYRPEEEAGEGPGSEGTSA